MSTILRVRERAEAQNHTISSLQRRADITMSTMRRYWYGTRDGREDGPPLEELNLPVLRSIARVLGVTVIELLGEEGRTLLAAMS